MRIFFSISIEVTDELSGLLHRLRKMGRGIKAVREDKLHLTLKFLGEIKSDFVPRLEQVLDDVAARHHSFELVLEGMGVFPNERQPRVVWVGLKENASLKTLVEDLQSTCQGPGFEKDQQAFNPHVTVARCQPHDARDMKALQEEFKTTLFATQNVKTIHLTQSMLDEQPVRYRSMRIGTLRDQD